MRRFIAVLAAVLSYPSAAPAAYDSACAVASPLVSADVGLGRVAAAIHQDRRLDIAVVGTGSSILAGSGGADIAYPARLQAALAERLPGVAVKVSSYAKPRQTAADMAKDFGKILSGAKPALVVWQSGTFDAIKGFDPDDFRLALDAGVKALQDAGSDVVLMNMQYSPRTESMIAIHAYADNMRWVAQNREVPLFDRFAVMKQWSELGTFDLFSGAGNVETAARVHDCIGQLLADLVIEGAKLHRAQNKAIQ
jgi:GDSL-like Lipase/Acylhydrolase family